MNKIKFNDWEIELVNKGRGINCSRVATDFYEFDSRIIKKYFDRWIESVDPITLGGKIHQVFCVLCSDDFYQKFNMSVTERKKCNLTMEDILENCKEINDFKKMVEESELKDGYSVQIWKDGDIVEEFKTVREAREKMGFTNQGIDRAIHIGIKTKGYEVRLIANF